MNLAYFLGMSKPNLAMSDLAMSDLAMSDHAMSDHAMSDYAMSDLAMSDHAKPESGRFLFRRRVEDLHPPSGVCRCTSERVDCQLDAYKIDTPALRFCYTSRLRSCRTSRSEVSVL